MNTRTSVILSRSLGTTGPQTIFNYSFCIGSSRIYILFHYEKNYVTLNKSAILILLDIICTQTAGTSWIKDDVLVNICC